MQGMLVMYDRIVEIEGESLIGYLCNIPSSVLVESLYTCELARILPTERRWFNPLGRLLDIIQLVVPCLGSVNIFILDFVPIFHP